MVAETQIEELSREGLITVIQELIKENRVLAAEIAGLKQPRTTSQNSSQPPSRDFKGEKKKRKRSKKKGAQAWHEKQARQWVEKPNKVVDAYMDKCQNCSQNLLDQIPVKVICRQVTEIPETRQYVVDCPCCGERQQAKLPEGLEAGRHFGPRLEAIVTNLHHEHHVGYKRLRQICNELFGLELSAGGAVSIVERAGQAAIEEAEAIGEQVRQVVGSDETNARMHACQKLVVMGLRR